MKYRKYFLFPIQIFSKQLKKKKITEFIFFFCHFFFNQTKEFFVMFPVPITKELPTIMESYKKNKTKKDPHKPQKSKFTLEDDILLMRLVLSLPVIDWSLIASRMKNRNARQCRERWKNYLDPHLVQNGFTPQEDAFILQKYQEIGPHWNTIARFFRGRSGNSIRNRFLMIKRHEEKRIKEMQEQQQKELEQQQQDPQEDIIEREFNPESPELIETNYFTSDNQQIMQDLTKHGFNPNIEQNVINTNAPIQEQTTQHNIAQQKTVYKQQVDLNDNDKKAFDEIFAQEDDFVSGLFGADDFSFLESFIQDN